MFQRWRTEDSLAAPDAVEGNLARTRLFTALVALLNALHVLGLVAAMTWRPAADPAAARWRLYLACTHAIMGVAMLVGGRVAARAQRAAATSVWARAIPVGFGALGLGFASVIALIDQWVTPNITPVVLSTIGLAIVLRVRPRTSAAVYLGNYALFFALLPVTQSSEVLVLSNRLGALGNAIIGWGLSVMFWRNFTTIALQQRALTEANAALELRQTELQEFSRRDALTALLNRHAFCEVAARELTQAAQSGRPTALLLLDLDHFKQVNDTWGHPAGDEVLRQVGGRFARAVRPQDTVARLGGEEFVVLMPDTDVEDAVAMAEALRASVKAEALTWMDVSVDKTVSIGVSVTDGAPSTTFSTLYADADRALYRAKTGGRDRVVRYEEHSPSYPGKARTITRRDE